MAKLLSRIFPLYPMKHCILLNKSTTVILSPWSRILHGAVFRQDDNINYTHGITNKRNYFCPLWNGYDKPFPSFAQLFVQSAPKPVQPYLKLMRLDRPIGSWLLYWPCGWSIALAANPGTLPDLSLLLLFGIGAVCMRGAGCTINDMWDKNFDAKVERTKLRPLASGEISRVDALAFLGGQLGISVLILSQLNYNCILLGISSMALVVSYPLMKRFTNWPQFVLGLAFNWGALMGWAAVKGSCDWTICLPLYIAGISWTLIYDTIYAHQDRTDDLIIGVKSTAILFDKSTPKWLALFSTIMTSSLLATGIMSAQTTPYYVAVGAVTLQQLYHIATLDIRDEEKCFRQFKANRWTGLIIFLGIVTSTLFTKEKSEKIRNPTLIINEKIQ